MADDGPTSPADNSAYQHTDDDTAPAPVASTILSQDIASVEETVTRRSKTRVCYTGLLQQQRQGRSENGSETTTSDDPAGYSDLLQKPSQWPSQPFLRPPHHRHPNPPGLIVRGRVFHVRVAVPRKVQATVGRREVWRPLGTGNRSEAIRKSKLLAADFERSFMVAVGASDPEAVCAEIVGPKPVSVDQATGHAMTFWRFVPLLPR